MSLVAVLAFGYVWAGLSIAGEIDFGVMAQRRRAAVLALFTAVWLPLLLAVLVTERDEK